MAHTIRNQKTKGYLDKLEHRRMRNKMARDMKAINLFEVLEVDYEGAEDIE